MSNRKALNVARIAIWSVIGIAAICAMVQFSSDRWSISGRWSIGSLFEPEGRYDLVIREETVREDIRDIDIDWKIGELVIVSGAGDEITLTEKAAKTDQESNLLTSIEDGRLSVSSRQRFGFSFLWWNGRNTRLEITLPQKMYDSLVIDAASGDYALSDMEIGLLSMELSSGDCVLSSLAIENFTIKLTSGDLRLDEISADRMEVTLTSGKLNGERLDMDILDVRITSGEMDLSGRFPSIDMKITSGTSSLSSTVLPEHLVADMTSGRMVFALPEGSGFSAEVNITSGNFESEFDMRSSDDVHTYKDGGPAYRLSCTSGDLRILILE